MTSRPAAAGSSVGARLAALPRTRLVVGAFALLALLTFVLLYRKGTDMTFYFDEWDFVLRRHQTTAGVFLEPHNEHFSLVPVAVYKLLFATAGLDHYAPYRIVALLLHLTVAALVFVWVRSRAGDAIALAAATLMLFLGAGFEDVLWPFQIGFLFALASGIGAFILVERDTRRADLVAAVLLGVSLASASLGIPIVLGVAAYLLVRPARRRRLWVVLAPLVLYAIWYAGYGKSALKRENLTSVPEYTADEVAGAVGGLVGLSLEWGRVLALAAVGAVVLYVSRVRTLSRAFAMVLVTALAFWLLTALARAELNEPASSRYIYAGGLLVLLIAAEAVRGARFGRRALWLLGGLAAFAAVSGMHVYRKGADGLRFTDRIVRAEITPLDIGGAHMPPGFAPDPQRAPQIVAKEYLEAISDIGSSPSYSEAELARRDEGHRRLADNVFVRGYALSLVPGAQPPAGPAPVPLGVAALRIARRGSCAVVAPRVAGGPVTVSLRVPPGGMSLQAPGASVTLRRFASAYENATPLSGSAARALLRIPRDRSARPWWARVAGAHSVRACGLP